MSLEVEDESWGKVEQAQRMTYRSHPPVLGGGWLSGGEMDASSRSGGEGALELEHQTHEWWSRGDLPGQR